MSRWLAGALAAAAVTGCAQPQAPPGGEADRTPPQVVAVTPAMYDTVADPGTEVVIRFDERLSERLHGVSSLEDAVLVSPATGEVGIERGRREVRVRIGGGWQPGLVYRVVVLPVFADRFQNRRTEPIELVFSTGAPIPETAVGGFVRDRLTGQPLEGARVEATRRIDSLSYTAVSDTGGFFAMRHIPAAAYDVRAWVDANRNRRPDFAEPQVEDRIALGFQDTVVVELPLLPRDTTPARLLRAEAVDSTKVRLTFDDYFEPGPVDGEAAVYRLADTTFVADGELVHGTRLDSIRAAERAVADSLRRLREDTLRLEQDTADVAEPVAEPEDPADTLARTDPRVIAAPRPPERERPGGGRPAGPPLPSRDLILLLPRPLPPGESFLVVVEGVTNIHGLDGGGGSARFTAHRPESADETEAPADTVGGP